MTTTSPDSLATFSREEFLSDYWRYRDGEHLTILGPTGCGKTYLKFDLIKHTATKKRPAIVLAAKPRDETIRAWNEKLKFPITREWPPTRAKRLLHSDTKGWIVWPQHTFEPQKDNERLFEVFRKTILDAYKRGNRILDVDECYAASAELHLEEELITVWSRGRSMGTAIWTGSQKPTHIPLWAYNQAEHLFLAYEPDARARKRFDEIGGVDRFIVENAVLDLDRHEFLYIRRDGPVMCKITAE